MNLHAGVDRMYDYDLLVIVINYNSKHFIGIVKRLMESIAELNKYLRTKLLFVDNASRDDSFEEAVEHAQQTGVDIRAIRLSRNLGYARAINVAWHYARKRWRFKYVAFFNNDLVIVPSNLAKITRYLELHKVAGVQGIIMQMSHPKIIDNCGHMIGQTGLTYPVCRGYSLDCAKLYTPSFLSGACSIYRASVISELGQPFDSCAEDYFDDKLLGLRLWSRGYRLLHIPIVVAFHLGSASYSYNENGIIKGHRWFEGIVFADLALIVKAKKFLFLIIALYIVLSILGSIFTMNNYIKSFILVIKKLRNFTNEVVDSEKTPQLRDIKSFIKYNRLYKGIRLKNKEFE